MGKKLYIFVGLIISIAFSVKAQNASDYFPSVPGFKWFYNTIPFDSLNHPVDSLSFLSVDSFAVNRVYVNKTAKVQLRKIGTKETVLKSSYLDTNYVSLDSLNIWNYIGSFPGIDTLGIGFFSSLKGWYSVYRLSQAINSSYTIYTKDSTINYNGLNTTFTNEINSKRLVDQTIFTSVGNFLCKKFVLTYAIKAKVLIFTTSILTINDTVYIAPGNYIVRDIRPSANVDLSSFGLIAFFIPGNRMDILAPPAVLDVNHQNITIKYSAGDSSFTVSNSGSDTLHWYAKVKAGSPWLHLNDTSGKGNSIIRFSFTQNTDNSLRIGLISIEDTTAWGSPKIITITQEKNITSINDKNGIPSQYTLFQNYPNPFNPVTSIKYSLPFDSNVKIIIYNTTGQVVKELVSGVQLNGIHELSFLPVSLSSGIYFYSIHANSVDGKQKYTNTKKMILLK